MVVAASQALNGRGVQLVTQVPLDPQPGGAPRVLQAPPLGTEHVALQPPVTPEVNDWVSANVGGGDPHYRRITDVQLSGSDYVCTLASAFPGTSTSNRTGYEGITSRIQWQGLTAGSPAIDALWREIQVQYD
ncbi:hypothetical protein [Sandaracinus amylolyticus]|uniref:hypothetical protein n=2 Tax=Sandaracinus TaxID=1055688 RepID=UPI001AF6AB1E|nr:hypothetical protein [Sandaracinus amylolyticus]QRN75746.1 Hypothetical protein MSR10575_88330 [Sandaracinus sp.]UJR87242.1 Hypothetical protein I5071_340 [Sandaracinus amylolyticus]